MKLLVAVLWLLALAGCAGNAQLIKALSQDEASVCIHIGPSVYSPPISISRTKIQNGNVSCTADGGLQVKSDNVNVPLTVGVQAVGK